MTTTTPLSLRLRAPRPAQLVAAVAVAAAVTTATVLGVSALDSDAAPRVVPETSTEGVNAGDAYVESLIERHEQYLEQSADPGQAYVDQLIQRHRSSVDGGR